MCYCCLNLPCVLLIAGVIWYCGLTGLADLDLFVLLRLLLGVAALIACCVYLLDWLIVVVFVLWTFSWLLSLRLVYAFLLVCLVFVFTCAWMNVCVVCFNCEYDYCVWPSVVLIFVSVA